MEGFIDLINHIEYHYWREWICLSQILQIQADVPRNIDENNISITCD